MGGKAIKSLTDSRRKTKGIKAKKKKKDNFLLGSYRIVGRDLLGENNISFNLLLDSFKPKQEHG